MCCDTSKCLRLAQVCIVVDWPAQLPSVKWYSCLICTFGGGLGSAHPARLERVAYRHALSHLFCKSAKRLNLSSGPAYFNSLPATGEATPWCRWPACGARAPFESHIRQVLCLFCYFVTLFISDLPATDLAGRLPEHLLTLLAGRSDPNNIRA